MVFGLHRHRQEGKHIQISSLCWTSFPWNEATKILLCYWSLFYLSLLTWFLLHPLRVIFHSIFSEEHIPRLLCLTTSNSQFFCTDYQWHSSSSVLFTKYAEKNNCNLEEFRASFHRFLFLQTCSVTDPSLKIIPEDTSNWQVNYASQNFCLQMTVNKEVWGGESSEFQSEFQERLKTHV